MQCFGARKFRLPILDESNPKKSQNYFLEYYFVSVVKILIEHSKLLEIIFFKKELQRILIVKKRNSVQCHLGAQHFQLQEIEFIFKNFNQK